MKKPRDICFLYISYPIMMFRSKSAYLSLSVGLIPLSDGRRPSAGFTAPGYMILLPDGNRDATGDLFSI